MKTNVSIDEVGRMVLPKSVRESLGISGRTSVRVEVFGGRAEIVPAGESASETCEVNGRVVSRAPLPEGWDSGEAVARMREERGRR
jgi:AbrB family looped-hinge helix DNA binding protein